MIDIEKAKQEFIIFVSRYDLNEREIDRKKFHSIRVMEISTNLAKSMNLSQEDIDLATLIGLLHDISRFKQWTECKTFRDLNSFDHGDMGVEILKKDNYIRKYVEDAKYDEIIFKAIRNHNKLRIEDGLNERELLFAKIIRDADKLDIFYEGTCIFYETEEKRNEIETSKLTDECYEEFINYKAINRKYVQNKLDSVINLFSFIFDLNLDYSKKYLYEKDYLNMIYARFDFNKNQDKDKIRNLVNIANEYLRK